MDVIVVQLIVVALLFLPARTDRSPGKRSKIDLNDLVQKIINLIPLQDQPRVPPYVCVEGTMFSCTASEEVTEEEMDSAMDVGNSHINLINVLEKTLHEKNVHVPHGSSSYHHQQGFKSASPIAMEMGRVGIRINGIKSTIIKEASMAPIAKMIPTNVAMKLSMECETTVNRIRKESACKRPRYRKIDGSCNNLRHPEYGVSFTPFRRVLTPKYGDGISSLRLAASGNELPSPRLVSTSVNIGDNDDTTSSLSLFHMTYGQFLDHEITKAPIVKGLNGSSIPCCVKEVLDDPSLLHPECAAIKIPADDSFYSQFGETCMEFVRSTTAPICDFGPREQVNQITAWIDGSVLYGSTPDITKSLRTFKDGLLTGQMTKYGQELLPRSLSLDDGCNTEKKIKQGKFCFKSGDGRVNEQALLTVTHTLWARQHSHVATELKRLHPKWKDERLFQETRRIIAAQLQQVYFNEYIPPILGDTLTDALRLRPKTKGKYTKDYDSSLNPSMSAAFSTSAFRFGHSQVLGTVKRTARSGSFSIDELNGILFNPYEIYNKNGVNRLMRGHVDQVAPAVDGFFSLEVAGKMFRDTEDFGLDLIALNLQRGRDHGVPGYTEARKICGLPAVSSFSDLSDIMSDASIESFESVYEHVDDIDLFVGGLAERHVPGGIVGPTFACIMADQFLRIKRGDRYWYEYIRSPGRFTKAQLKEIRKVTLARIICDNVPEIKSIQRWALKKVSKDNKMYRCKSSSIPSYSLKPWS